MIHVGYYAFEIGQEFDTGTLGKGYIEGVRNGRLCVRLPGKVINGKRKKKIPRCYYSPEALRKHISIGRVKFNACQMDLFGGAV